MLLSRFQDKANDNLLKALNGFYVILGTLNLKLRFNTNNVTGLSGFVDSDWGGDITDRNNDKSTTGYIFKLDNCVISWASKKQQTVSISSTESKYNALRVAISEACWLKKLVNNFNVYELDEPIILYEDNQSAINIANNPENNKRLKHVHIKCKFIKEKN